MIMNIYTVRRFVTTLLALVAVTAMAAVPESYYTTLNGKRDSDLKTAIYKLVRNFTQVSSYNALPQYFQKTDVYPESSRWWDMYSDIPLYAPLFSGLNREHSFPKSWWGGTTTIPAYTDLNHLYPSEAKANQAKSNYPLGEVDRTQRIAFENGITTVGYPVTGQGGGAKSVFEPADEYKGDFARTYFYMVSAYQDLKWNTSYMFMLQQNTWPTLNAWSISLLLKWHRADPVSEKETLRNDAVYKIQNNRNPFIDYPELAEYIWGNKQGSVFYTQNSGSTTGTPELVTPVQDMSLDFGEVALGRSATARLYFKGNNLTEPVTVRVYTGDNTKFAVSTNSIAANLINSDEGYWLPVTYTPGEIGDHTSRILIVGGGLAGSRGIALRGSCLPVPTLTAPVATAPTFTDHGTYIANWTVPADEVVDYYYVTRTRYPQGGTPEQTELLAESNSLEISDYDPDVKESYTVQSSRLEYRSPASNTIYVEYGGIEGVVTDIPLAVYGIGGAIRFICSTPHTGVMIYSATGALAATAESVSNNTDIEIAPGVYLIVTDQSHRPLKVIVK